MSTITIILENNTTETLTLNSSTMSDADLFLGDTSFSVPAGTSQTVVSSSWQSSNSITYNITEAALVEVSWTANKQAFIVTATTPGTSTDYVVSGYSTPSSTTTDPADSEDYFYTYTISVSSS